MEEHKGPPTPIRVVLADDHPAVRAGLRLYLERDAGIIVVAEASDGEQALAAIEQYRPDVAVLDLQMPVLSGIEATRRLQQSRSGVRVLVVTAYDDDPLVLAALRAGAKGYLLKTASPDALAQAVRRVFAGRPVLDPVVSEHLVEQIGREAGADGERVERPSERELDVLRLAARGLTNREIGERLAISERTVHSHLMNVFDKLNVKTRTEAVIKAIHRGWLALQDTAD